MNYTTTINRGQLKCSVTSFTGDSERGKCHYSTNWIILEAAGRIAMQTVQCVVLQYTIWLLYNTVFFHFLLLSVASFGKVQKIYIPRLIDPNSSAAAKSIEIKAARSKSSLFS